MINSLIIRRDAPKIINLSCLKENFKLNLDVKLSKRAKFTYVDNSRIDYILNNNDTYAFRLLTSMCNKNVIKPGAVQIGPTFTGYLRKLDKVNVYHMCDATQIAAAKRQAITAPMCTQVMLREFKKYFFAEIFPSIKKMIDASFICSKNIWFNHLTAAQQKLYGHFSDADLLRAQNDYELFGKKQRAVCPRTGKADKVRCISNSCPEKKYAMGPITYSLEAIFSEGFKGYSGNKNWDDYAELFSELHFQGLIQTLQLDGSGFDTTQHFELKFIDRAIYQYIADNYVLHVPKEIFLKFALSSVSKFKVFETRTLRETTRRVLLKFSQYGCVQSGNMDTTLMNTIRMAIYNRFTLERKKLVWGVDYYLLAKGDDVVVFLRIGLAEAWLKEIYFEVFAKDMDQGLHGLGQVAKYLLFGDMDGIEFCSTHTFMRMDGTFRVVRQLPRVLTLTPFSEALLAYDDINIQKYIKYSLAEGGLFWAKGLPIYDVYFSKIMLENADFDMSAINMAGKDKESVLLDTMEQNWINVWKTSLPVQVNNRFIAKDHSYNGINKKTTNTQDSDYETFSLWLFRKYSITEEDIKQIEYDIKNCGINDKITTRIVDLL